MTSKEAWNARDNLLTAAQVIESACSWAEMDEVVYDRLGEFKWIGVAASLDEVAAELRAAGEFIVTEKTRVQSWEETEHLCGYSVFMGENDHCFHEGCWEEAEIIEIALAMRKQVDRLLTNFQVEREASRPYPQNEKEAHWCHHGNQYWFGHECGLCEEGL
jgi:hypothetical protein